MRYVALIGLINFVLITIAGVILAGGTDLGSALLGAMFFCAFGIPIAIILGIPMLWIARRLAPGSLIPLAPLGAIAGALCPMIVTLGAPIQPAMVALGFALGLVSAALWWALVERFPERRAYYE